LCTQYSDVFGLEVKSITTNIFYKQKLRLKDEKPIYIKNYRNPHSQKDEIQKQVQKIINEKLWNPLYEKKKWRLVIDYRQINKKLKRK